MGSGEKKSLYQPLAHGAVYFGRVPGMVRTKQTANKSGAAIRSRPPPAKDPVPVVGKPPHKQLATKQLVKGGGKGENRKLITKNKVEWSCSSSNGSVSSYAPEDYGRRHREKTPLSSSDQVIEGNSVLPKACWTTGSQVAIPASGA